MSKAKTLVAWWLICVLFVFPAKNTISQQQTNQTAAGIYEIQN